MAPSTSSSSGSGSKQSVRITQFTDPADILITDTDELQTMDKFITKKIREMEEGGRKKAKESMVDTVFKSALKDFKANLISTYSVGNYQEGYFRLTYKDLIDHFEQVRKRMKMEIGVRFNPFSPFSPDSPQRLPEGEDVHLLSCDYGRECLSRLHGRAAQVAQQPQQRQQ